VTHGESQGKGGRRWEGIARIRYDGMQTMSVRWAWRTGSEKVRWISGRGQGEGAKDCPVKGQVTRRDEVEGGEGERQDGDMMGRKSQGEVKLTGSRSVADTETSKVNGTEG